MKKSHGISRQVNFFYSQEDICEQYSSHKEKDIDGKKTTLNHHKEWFEKRYGFDWWAYVDCPTDCVAHWMPKNHPNHWKWTNSIQNIEIWVWITLKYLARFLYAEHWYSLILCRQCRNYYQENRSNKDYESEEENPIIIVVVRRNIVIDLTDDKRYFECLKGTLDCSFDKLFGALFRQA